jgi:hypothetical protein
MHILEADADDAVIVKPSADDYAHTSRGRDGKLYLVFNSNIDAELFVKSMKSNLSDVPLHHFNGYQNAILIEDRMRCAKTS